jgi:hypothetical protein
MEPPRLQHGRDGDGADAGLADESQPRLARPPGRVHHPAPAEPEAEHQAGEQHRHAQAALEPPALIDLAQPWHQPRQGRGEKRVPQVDGGAVVGRNGDQPPPRGVLGAHYLKTPAPGSVTEDWRSVCDAAGAR